MRTDDIYMLGVIMNALGYKERQFAQFLGGNWKRWSPYHVAKVKELIHKRIKLVSTDGRGIEGMGQMSNALYVFLGAIEKAEIFERDLMRKQRRVSLDKLRDLAQDNGTTVRNLEKVMRGEGWKRTRENRRVVWVRK